MQENLNASALQKSYTKRELRLIQFAVPLELLFLLDGYSLLHHINMRQI
jgi:hypothetical protein